MIREDLAPDLPVALKGPFTDVSDAVPVTVLQRAGLGPRQSWPRSSLPQPWTPRPQELQQLRRAVGRPPRMGEGSALQPTCSI